MSRLRATTPIEVDIGPCECPDTPHSEGDKAWLRPRMTAGGGLEATAYVESFATDVRKAVQDGKDPDELIPGLVRALGMIYLRDGLLGWTLLDDDEQEVPLSAIEGDALDWDETIRPIADKASEVYGTAVMAPLVRVASPSSKRGRTGASTSATNRSTRKSRKRSGRSTTSTTPRAPKTSTP